jgi:signal peptidase II
MRALEHRPRREQASDRRWPALPTGPWARAALVLAIVVAADQLSKRAVERSIVPGEERKLLPGVQLVDTRNHGIAFGVLTGSQVVVTILIGAALLVLLVYFARHSRESLIWLPTGMLVGGAAGNVIDRIRAGSVTDFIQLPLGWPPFNLADASITLGVVALFLVIEHARHQRLHVDGADRPETGAGVREGADPDRGDRPDDADGAEPAGRA